MTDVRTITRGLYLAFASVLFATACASSPGPGEADEPSDVGAPTDAPATERSESAAPAGGAACGDRTCASNELCVPTGFCSGIRPPTEEESRAASVRCVAIPPACAEAPDCACAGDVCAYGGCASIVHGVVMCICA